MRRTACESVVFRSVRIKLVSPINEAVNGRVFLYRDNDLSRRLRDGRITRPVMVTNLHRLKDGPACTGT
jgi:hypothetical protein